MSEEKGWQSAGFRAFVGGGEKEHLQITFSVAGSMIEGMYI